MDSLPSPALPARWLWKQQLLFAASLHGLNGHATQVQQDELFGQLWEDSLAPTGNDLIRYRARLQTLPPSLLELLCSLTGEQVDCWTDHQHIWQEVRDDLQWTLNRRRSPLAAAKLIADRLRDSSLEPPQIRRLVKTELMPEAADWDDIPNIDRRLEDLTRSLRGGEPVYGQLMALDLFGRAQKPLRWEMVENALLEQLFSWPLLVTPGGNSCALPVLVNLDLANGNVDGSWEVVDGPHTDGSDWSGSLAKARKAAIDLWLSKHSSADKAFQDAVTGARIALDLRIASAIVSPILGREKLLLEGGSLESYVALEILSLILEGRGTKGVCATGELGARYGNGFGRFREKKGGFWDIVPIPRLDSTTDWINEKVTRARRSFAFDRILVPGGSVAAGYQGHLRIIDVATDYLQDRGNGFAGYANEALGQNWRRHRELLPVRWTRG